MPLKCKVCIFRRTVVSQSIMQSTLGMAMPSEPDAGIHDRSLHSASQSSTPRATHWVRFIQGAMGFERVAQRHSAWLRYANATRSS